MAETDIALAGKWASIRGGNECWVILGFCDNLSLEKLLDMEEVLEDILGPGFEVRWSEVVGLGCLLVFKVGSMYDDTLDSGSAKMRRWVLR